MERVILGLGSNQGDKGTYLRNAVSALALILRDIITSSVYKTAPQDYFEQDDFFNMVALGYYEGKPEFLLQQIKEIEKDNGRRREKEIEKGPRTLDIDILFFGNVTLETPTLTLPHPAIKKRAFVLIPLLELLPDFKEAGDAFSYKDLLEQLKDQRVERIGELERV